MKLMTPRMQSRLRRNGTRRGAAAVEFAVVAPVLFLMLFGMIEMGRAVMVAQIACNASREGCRKAVVATPPTVTSVTTYVKSYLSAAGVPDTSATVTIAAEDTNGAFQTTTSLSDVSPGSGIRVTVAVNFHEVSWLPKNLIKYFSAADNIRGTTIMRKEGDY